MHFGQGSCSPPYGHHVLLCLSKNVLWFDLQRKERSNDGAALRVQILEFGIIFHESLILNSSLLFLAIVRKIKS